jgi:2-methylisocitrate lyase-like PEP mutase family enzyme
MSSQRENADRLRNLHRSGNPLLLVNAWDAVSARIIESIGFAAVATTSAGIAWAEGFPDGEQISRERMLARVSVVTQAVDVPVTADLEGGYGRSVGDAQETARGAIEAGAVGLNFEDAAPGGSALLDIEEQAERIAAIQSVGAKLGVPLVINARTDVFLADIGDNDAWRLQETIRRGKRYREAGADCFFVPGVVDEPTISAIVAGVPGPINILAGPKAPTPKRLGELGVARISLGSGAMSYVLAEFRKVAQSLRDGSDFAFLANRITHAQLNALVDRRHDHAHR